MTMYYIKTTNLVVLKTYFYLYNLDKAMIKSEFGSVFETYLQLANYFN